MRIGIDVRALQTGHKFRGIGEVTKQVVDRLPEKAPDDSQFILFMYDRETSSDPLDMLPNISKADYDVVELGPDPELKNSRTKQQKIKKNYQKLFGDPLPEVKGKCDVYLQFDYAFGIPKTVPSVLVKHDLIPFIFWNQYFTPVKQHIKNRALRSTLRTGFHNYRSKKILKKSVADATSIVTVSAHTKKDLEKVLGVASSKITASHLGVSDKPAKTLNVSELTIKPSKPYLLFIGAADARRRVEDLVAAYNYLKAHNNDMQLVLVGENFQSKEKIPNTIVRQAILDSSYSSDILTLGYVNDRDKAQLMANATAFVYPTLYEGFGIPVLEAMLARCPVITYRNSSIPEVGGDYVVYADGWENIANKVISLQTLDSDQLSKLIENAHKHAAKYTWDKITQDTFQQLKNEVTIVT